MISVIIPVYNTEKYIDQCIESVVKQSYQDLEIVIVDDGSTDSSGAKCDAWAKRDPRIQVFHKSNGGLMSAWKYGVNRSAGEYIGFVDSDDWIDSNMYETLLKHIGTKEAELALCGLIAEFESSRPSQQETLLLNKPVYDRASIVNEIYPIAICAEQAGSRGVSPNRVTKLYKRQLIVDVMQDCPEDVSIGEDLVSTTSTITRCSRLCVVHDFHPYHYRVNDASMTQMWSDAKYEKIRKLNKALVEIDVKNGDVFTQQIANDYINLICHTIDQEICLSGNTYLKLKEDIKREVASPIFAESLEKMNPRKCTFKERLYLFFIRFHLWGGIILARKLYRRA